MLKECFSKPPEESLKIKTKLAEMPVGAFIRMSNKIGGHRYDKRNVRKHDCC